MLRYSRFCVVLALLIFPLIGPRLAAQFLYPEVKTVPVERLIRNLETIVAKEPQNANPLVNLARLHAMVFARKLASDDPVEVATVFESEGPWFGVGVKPIVPFKNVETKDAERLKEAKEHLRTAIDLYRRAIALEPQDVRAKLGYAWCIEQSGERAQAIAAYRQVIAEAWAYEQRGARPTETTGRPAENTGFPDQIPMITSEASRYLIPLLDREKDRDEIATLQDRMQMLQSVGRFITPIVIPLGDGAAPENFMDGGARVSFDADGSGSPKRWTWITPEAAWLVHAPGPDHTITSALQLFGSVTFWLFWENGYQAMTALDDNGDGALTGTELDDLALWRDADRNGVAGEGEVKTLTEWDIVALDCAHEKTRGGGDYVAFSPKGVTFKNGHTRPTWDILLYAHSSRGAATE